jgi:hypothetical protein
LGSFRKKCFYPSAPQTEVNLWAEATVEEQRKLLLTMLDGVYIDAKQTKSIVAIRPKPAFKPVFQVAVTKEGSDIRIINEPLNGTSVFLVETGETLCVPQTRFIIEQFNGYRSSLVSALI